MRLICAVLVCVPGQALAEVCDKERPDGSGEAWRDWLYVPELSVFLLVSAVFIVGWMSRRSARIAAPLLGAHTAATVLDLTRAGLSGFSLVDGVRAGAVLEGCIAPPYVMLVGLTGLTRILVTRAITRP